MRDLGHVLMYLVRHVIPEEQKNLHDDLNIFIKNLAYQPPEMMSHYWRELADVLYDNLGNPSKDPSPWKERLVRIMRDEEKIPDNFDSSLPHVDDYVVVSRV